MAAFTPFIDSNKAFPFSLSGSMTLTLGDDDDLIEKVREVAIFVSQVYAKFPRLNKEERTQLRDQNVWIERIEALPPENQCEVFERILSFQIHSAFLGQLSEAEFIARVYLKTDYSPQGVLLRAAEWSFSEFMQDSGHPSSINPLFPYKTMTMISFYKKTSVLELRMDLTGPHH